MAQAFLSPERQFMDWYNQLYPLEHGQFETMSVYDMQIFPDENDLLAGFNNAFTTLRNCLSQEQNNAALGVVYVGYGFCSAAVQTKRGICVVANQSGFDETYIWPYNATKQLGIDSLDIEEENDQSFALDAFLQWTIEPWDKSDLFYDVYRKILKKIILETIDRLGDGIGKALLVSLPPISRDVKADWEAIVTSIMSSDCAVFLTDHAVWFDRKPQERLFSFHRHQYVNEELFLVEVYNQSSDPAMAFSFLPMNQVEENTELSQVTCGWIVSSARKTTFSTTMARTGASGIFFPTPKFSGIGGFTAFLQRHSASFRDAMFMPKDVVFPQNGMIAEIERCFQAGVATPAIHIMARLCGETNQSQIALFDMVTICSLLENGNFFQRTDVVTHKERMQFGNLEDLPIEQNLLPRLPSNFSSIGWGFSSALKSLPDYFSIDSKSLPDLQILLRTIVDHYDYCTTEDVASDLLYFVTNRSNEPSALLTAKVFLLLANDEHFRAIHVSEPMQQLHVDNQVYQQANLQPSMRQSPKSVESPYLKLSIGDIGLSVRSYNCLRRAGMEKVRDLIGKTDEELLRVRNLGNRGVEEIREWLENHKLS